MKGLNLANHLFSAPYSSQSVFWPQLIPVGGDTTDNSHRTINMAVVLYFDFCRQDSTKRLVLLRLQTIAKTFIIISPFAQVFSAISHKSNVRC